MKKSILITLLMGISIYVKTQCIVDIIPQSSTTFCKGDSVILIASASGDSLDQNQELFNGGISEHNLPGYYEWQSFTAGATGVLCQIELMFCNSSTILNGTGTLNIYIGTGISGTLLTTQTVNVNGAASGLNLPFWQLWTITTPPSMTSGQVYTFQFIPTQGGGLPDPYLIQVNIPSVYAGGNYSGGTGGDLTFRTYTKRYFYFLWSNGSTDSTIVADTSGTYFVAITDSSGCTSSDSLIVIVNTVDTFVSQSGVTLTADAVGAVYQWIDCNGNTPISGQTSQSFTAIVNGSYAVVITQNNCSDTSFCYNITTVGIIENNSATAITIYPNPSTGKFILEMGKNENGILEIFNVFGEKVYTKSNVNQQISNEINLSKSSKGIYFIRLLTDDGEKIQTEKIVIQ